MEATKCNFKVKGQSCILPSQFTDSRLSVHLSIRDCQVGSGDYAAGLTTRAWTLFFLLPCMPCLFPFFVHIFHILLTHTCPFCFPHSIAVESVKIHVIHYHFLGYGARTKMVNGHSISMDYMCTEEGKEHCTICMQGEKLN